LRYIKEYCKCLVFIVVLKKIVGRNFLYMMAEKIAKNFVSAAPFTIYKGDKLNTKRNRYREIDLDKY